MGTWFRRAGTGTLDDGRVVTWSVAEGGRGRRWRWTLATGEGTLLRAALLELDGDGRFARLEYETSDGMLTLHPEEDGQAAHGNVVRRRGVQPIAIAWWPGASVGLADDPFGRVVASWTGEGWIIHPDLTLRRGADGSRDDGPGLLERDDRGVPVLKNAREWPLEV
ncbi:hypothetical protein BH20CHL7_BH20CHL7_00090 [soil metagenome]